MERALAIKKEAHHRLQMMNEAMASGMSDVQRFYAGGVVLITGGSGFMGKQLLEKLFRSCEIRKTYLLLRPKKGKSVEDRLNEILKDPAFDSLQATHPDFKQRIVLVEGDVGKLKLGISEENWRDIIENVTMIFHVAATVKFDEALKTSVLTNVRGTREILHLAKACTHLRSFVYVSTAYSNVTKPRAGVPILEQFYPVPVSPEVLIHMVETFSDERLMEMTSKLIDGWPNTYSYSKAVAEEVVRIVGADLPACIVRPAIVINGYQEPLPGWIEPRCVYGTSGIGLSLIMGINHVTFCRDDVTTNFIPVDYVNNVILVAAVEAGERHGEKEMMIYNVTGERNFVWARCIDIFNNILSELPSPQIVGDCFAIKVTSNIGYYTLTLFLHTIPAAIVDFIFVLAGKRPWMTKTYSRIHKLSQVMKYFTLNNWLFDDKNTQALFHNMSNSDKFIYNFDRTTVDVPKMMILWSLGLREFVLRDELRGNEKGRKRKLLFKMVGFGLLFVYFSVFLLFIKLIMALF